MSVPASNAVTCLEPSLALDELESQITELAANINAATYRWLYLVAEFDRRDGWGHWGIRSCAHWLGWKCGIALGAAREKVRVARALEALPNTSQAFAAGLLSYSKARAITRVGTPENEEYLLTIAHNGTATHLEKVVRHYRRVKRLEELDRVNDQYAARDLYYQYDDDGMLVVQARLPAEMGAGFVKALEAVMGSRYQKYVPAGTSGAESETVEIPPIGAERADALCKMAESYLANEERALPGGDKHQIVVHADIETLAGSDDIERCEIENGSNIHPETLRRLGCDASVVTMIENGEETPFHVGRKTRTINPALRRALQSRDKGCRFPACTAHKWVDGHHIRHWADGGETRLENLVLLCRHHHRLVHEGGFQVEAIDDHTFEFRRPDGRVVCSGTEPVPSRSDLATLNRNLGLCIDDDTAVTRWSGERIDYGMAIDGLLWYDKPGSTSDCRE